MFGASSPYLQPHHFQFDTSFRALKSQYPNYTGYSKNYSITSGVINKQEVTEFVGTYQINSQASVSLALPFENGSFSFLYGPSPPQFKSLSPYLQQPLKFRARSRMRGRGFGDMTLVAHCWVLPTRHFTSGNVQFGLGVKFPTGQSNQKSIFPHIDGTDLGLHTNDQSIQPGDGSWGIITDLSAFKTVRLPIVHAATIFGFGTYLINTRGANGAPSIGQSLSAPAAFAKSDPAEFTDAAVDQYAGEVGFNLPVPMFHGIYASYAGRVEGVPGNNLVGSNAGFRRPGFVLFHEPGLSYAYGKNVWSLSVPIRCLQNITTVAVSHRHSDATVANWIILARYSRQL